MSPEKLNVALQRITQLFPKLERTDLNERTVYVWRRRWVDRASFDDIATERGWSRPAVSWHYRRATRALMAE
jgi:hypothetical protein